MPRQKKLCLYYRKCFRDSEQEVRKEIGFALVASIIAALPHRYPFSDKTDKDPTRMNSFESMPSHLAPSLYSQYNGYI